MPRMSLITREKIYEKKNGWGSRKSNKLEYLERIEKKTFKQQNLPSTVLRGN